MLSILDRGRPTSVRPRIRSDISEADGAFGLQALDKGHESRALDLPRGDQEHPYARGRNRREGINGHGDIWRDESAVDKAGGQDLNGEWTSRGGTERGRRWRATELRQQSQACWALPGARVGGEIRRRGQRVRVKREVAQHQERAPWPKGAAPAGRGRGR